MAIQWGNMYTTSGHNTTSKCVIHICHSEEEELEEAKNVEDSTCSVFTMVSPSVYADTDCDMELGGAVNAESGNEGNAEPGNDVNTELGTEVHAEEWDDEVYAELDKEVPVVSAESCNNVPILHEVKEEKREVTNDENNNSPSVEDASSRRNRPLLRSCRECGKGFADMWKLNRHMKVHTVATKHCSYCGVFFGSLRGVDKHLEEGGECGRLHRKNVEEQKPILKAKRKHCSFCGEFFGSLRGVNEHLKENGECGRQHKESREDKKPILKDTAEKGIKRKTISSVVDEKPNLKETSERGLKRKTITSVVDEKPTLKETSEKGLKRKTMTSVVDEKPVLKETSEKGLKRKTITSVVDRIRMFKQKRQKLSLNIKQEQTVNNESETHNNELETPILTLESKSVNNIKTETSPDVESKNYSFSVFPPPSTKDESKSTTTSSSDVSKELTCPKCTSSFNTRKDLMKHEKEGLCVNLNDPYKCTQCGRELKNYRLWKRHIEVRIGGIPS